MAPGFDIFLLLFEQTNNLLQLCRFSSLAWLCSRAPFCSRGCLNWFCSVSQNKWGAWLWVWSPQLLWLKFSAPKDGGAAFRLTDEHIFITREIGNMAYWAERKKRKKKKKKCLGSRFVLSSINCGYCSVEMLVWRLTEWEPHTQASSFSSLQPVTGSWQLRGFWPQVTSTRKILLQIGSGRPFLLMHAAQGRGRLGGLGEPTYKGKGKQHLTVSTDSLITVELNCQVGIWRPSKSTGDFQGDLEACGWLSCRGTGYSFFRE